MSDELEGEQYLDVDISDLPTDSNPADRIAGESEDLERIKQVGEERAENLRDAGFETIVDIRNADVQDISAIENIGEETAEKIIAGDILELTGVKQERAEKLREAGFQTAEDVSDADPDELANISGTGDTLITRFKIEAAGYEFTGGPLSTRKRIGDPANIDLSIAQVYSRRRLWAIRSIGLSIVIVMIAYGSWIELESTSPTIYGPLFAGLLGSSLVIAVIPWLIRFLRPAGVDMKYGWSNTLSKIIKYLIFAWVFQFIYFIIYVTVLYLIMIIISLFGMSDYRYYVILSGFSQCIYGLICVSTAENDIVTPLPNNLETTKNALNKAEETIKKADTTGNTPRAEELLKRASQRLDEYELEEAQDLAEEAQLAAKPSTEYLLDKAKGHTKDAKTAFNQEAYENAIEDWKAGLQTYERALVLANERGDEDIADGINTSISQVKTNLRRTRQQQANAQMRSLAADGSDLVSEGNTLFEREQYQKAQSRFASARDTYEQAIEIATEWEFNDATRLREARAEAVTAIADVQVADIEAEIQVANDIQEDAPAEAVEKYQSLRERLTALELPEEYADQRERLLESVNDGEIQATIADARQTMADAEQQADTGEWTDAKTTYQDARDQLRDVSDLAIEYGLREYRDVADSLTEVCAENIDRITNDLTSVGSVEVELDEIDIIEAAQTSSSNPIASGSSSPAWQASPSRPTNVADSLRSELPEHEVLELVGSGGNADVHKVQLTESGTVAALKVPKGSGTLSSTVIDEFVSEAETWEKIDDHSNIVSIRDWGTIPYPWLLLEYVPGSLAALDADLSLYDKLELLETVADTLTYTHGRGVVHLDLKPSNILIDEDMAPKIGDWGLARTLMEHTQTQVGMSLPYSAPEQLTQQAGTIDHPTDIYQLGVVSYELLTGQLPFTSDRPLDLQRQIRETEPTPPSAVVADLPSEIDEILLTALQKHPSQRYERIILFRNSLRSVRSNIE